MNVSLKVVQGAQNIFDFRYFMWKASQKSRSVVYKGSCTCAKASQVTVGSYWNAAALSFSYTAMFYLKSSRQMVDVYDPTEVWISQAYRQYLHNLAMQSFMLVRYPVLYKESGIYMCF